MIPRHLAPLLKTAAAQYPIVCWRDSRGNEIDLVLDLGQRLLPIEIKSGETVAEDFFKGLEHWRRLTGKAEAPGALVYGGERSYHQRGLHGYAC